MDGIVFLLRRSGIMKNKVGKGWRGMTGDAIANVVAPVFTGAAPAGQKNLQPGQFIFSKLE